MSVTASMAASVIVVPAFRSATPVPTPIEPTVIEPPASQSAEAPVTVPDVMLPVPAFTTTAPPR